MKVCLIGIQVLLKMFQIHTLYKRFSVSILFYKRFYVEIESVVEPFG